MIVTHYWCCTHHRWCSITTSDINNQFVGSCQRLSGFRASGVTAKIDNRFTAATSLIQLYLTHNTVLLFIEIAIAIATGTWFNTRSIAGAFIRIHWKVDVLLHILRQCVQCCNTHLTNYSRNNYCTYICTYTLHYMKRYAI